jgi:hypothetical protein
MGTTGLDFNVLPLCCAARMTVGRFYNACGHAVVLPAWRAG